MIINYKCFKIKFLGEMLRSKNDEVYIVGNFSVKIYEATRGDYVSRIVETVNACKILRTLGKP
jgi:hypothetical protein